MQNYTTQFPSAGLIASHHQYSEPATFIPSPQVSKQAAFYPMELHNPPMQMQQPWVVDLKYLESQLE